MASAEIGSTGLSVTRLGLGGAGPPGGSFSGTTAAAAHATLERAYELGMRYFDTAPLYGRGTSETLFGEFLSGVPRGEFVVSSKVGRVANPELGGPPLFDFSRDRVLSSLAESLERLRLDAIDIVFLHLLGDTPHDYQQALHEALAALAELRSQGVVRAIGVGTTTETWEMLAPFAQDGGSDCFLLANRYTLIDHSALEQFLPLCLERRISVVLGGPYYMGILATDLTPRAVFDLFLQHRPGDAEILRQARRIGAVCANHGVPLKAAALRFGLGHLAVAATLIGTSTPQQVEENVQMASAPVPAALWAELKTEGLIPQLAPTPGSLQLTMEDSDATSTG